MCRGHFESSRGKNGPYRVAHRMRCAMQSPIILAVMSLETPTIPKEPFYLIARYPSVLPVPDTVVQVSQPR